jgi:hypothetical protein
LWHMIFMSRGEVTGYDDDLLWHVTIVMSHNEFNLEFRVTLFYWIYSFQHSNKLCWSGLGLDILFRFQAVVRAIFILR